MDRNQDVRRLTVNGTTLAVRQVGDGDPVLLLHTGFVADGMTPLLAEPALGRYRRISYHRRGYGASEPASGPVTVAQQAADAVAVLGALGIDRAHLVGHSYGANVAIEVARNAPEVVASLTLLEPLLLFAVNPSSAQYVIDTGAAAYPRLDGGDVAGALDTWLTGAFDAGYQATLERTLPGAFAQACRDAPTAFGIEVPSVQEWSCGPDDLRRIDGPVLSVLGGASTWPGFRETHEALLSWIPGAEGLVVPDATHLLQLAKPRAVADGLADFFTRQATTASPWVRTGEL
jgi:pimeloyl-ACP methyl ester carboxylesterase